jgi:hypothetical protein
MKPLFIDCSPPDYTFIKRSPSSVSLPHGNPQVPQTDFSFGGRQQRRHHCRNQIIRHHGLHLQRGFTAFNARKFQRIVYKIQQQFPGRIDLLQVFLFFYRIRFSQGKSRETEYSVKRRAQIVAHAGKEHRLCLVGPVRFQLGFPDLIDLLLIPFVGFRNIRLYSQYDLRRFIKPGIADLYSFFPARFDLYIMSYGPSFVT